MKISGKTIAFMGALALVPALALAQAKAAPSAPKAATKAPAVTSAPAPKTTAPAPQAAKTKTATAKPAATHATNGIIKSADATSLVITKTAKDTKTTTFTLNAATVTKGAMTPGARVEVRYHMDGTTNVATAVTASLPKSGK